MPGVSVKEKIDAAKFHLTESVRWKGPKLGIFEMRRHYTNYFRGLEGIKEYRLKLVTRNTEEEVIDVLKEIGQRYG